MGGFLLLLIATPSLTCRVVKGELDPGTSEGKYESDSLGNDLWTRHGGQAKGAALQSVGLAV